MRNRRRFQDDPPHWIIEGLDDEMKRRLTLTDRPRSPVDSLRGTHGVKPKGEVVKTLPEASS
jgi:hypothetical protein